MLSSEIFQKAPPVIIAIVGIFSLLSFSAKRFLLDVPKWVLGGYSCAIVILTDTPGLWITASALLLISEIDRREFRIPDVLTKPTLLILTLWFHNNLHLLLITWGWIAGMYWLTHCLPGSIGRGDIKFIGALLLLNGHFTIVGHGNFLLLLLFLASALALPTAMWRRVRGEVGPFAFAPAISGAAMLIFGGGAL